MVVEESRTTNRGRRLSILLRPEILLPILLAVAVLLLVVTTPSFTAEKNLQSLARQWAPVAILALGAATVILAGGADFSFASTVGLVSVVTAHFAVRTGSPWALLLAIPTGFLVGLINGTLVTALRMSPIVVTLGTLVFIRGVANVVARGTPILGVPSGYDWLGTAFVGPFPFAFVLAVVVVGIDLVVLSRTRLGLRIYATGDNAASTRGSGVSPYRVLFGAYLIAGLHWGIAGAILASRVDSGQPTLATGFEVTVLTAVFLGGVSLVGGSGRARGVVFASLLLAVLANGLNLLGVFSFIQQVVFGVLLIGAIFFTQYVASPERLDVGEE